MKRAVLIVFLAVLVLLGGCERLVVREADLGLRACLHAQVQSDSKTVALDARCSTGRIEKYLWDLDDGAGLVEGAPVMKVVYEEPGVYVVRLCVIGQSSGTQSNPDEPPGTPPWLGGGSASSSQTLSESWTYAIVDLAKANAPVPIIIAMQFGRIIGHNAYSGYVTFDAFKSLDKVGKGLAYRWEIIRVSPAGNDPNFPPFEPVISSEPSVTVWLWSPWCSGTGQGPWLYEARLKVMDGNMQIKEGVYQLWVW